MRSSDQVVWDFVQQWLDKAERDLQAARILLASEIEEYESVGFHAQQAAEKFIKAFLVRHQVEFPKTHDIARLRELVASVDSELARRVAPADSLTPYGVEFRYPGDLGSIAQEQGREALHLAEQARDQVRETLRAYFETGQPDADSDSEDVSL